MSRDKFMFFENFKATADKLPDELRLKFYDALFDYAFYKKEPEDPIISAMVNLIKPSLDKVDGRSNNGGNHNPEGKNQHIKDNLGQSEVNLGQTSKELGQKEVNSGQSRSIPLETETRNRNKKQVISDEITLSYMSDFDDFWENYTPVKASDGRVVGKGSKEEAKRKFINILKGGETYENIRTGLRKYLAFCQQNNQLTCGVTVFLNQKRWLDDYDCQTVDAERTQRQRQEPASVLEPYAEMLRDYGNPQSVHG